MRGINYNKTNERDRSRRANWHSSPYARDFTQVTRRDVAGLSRKYYHELYDGKYYKTTMGIGFEIEKLESPNEYQEFPLFKGYETDSSLENSPNANRPVEAITNILPLVPNSNLKNKVMDMMVEASEVLDLPIDRVCGGHITLSAKGYSGVELKAALRPFSGLIYAIYKGRLRNGYSNADIFLNRTNRSDRGVLFPKPECAEFRLPSAVPSTNAMQRRYSLFFELMDFAVNKPTARLSSFLEKCRPILMRMYSSDSKVNEVIHLAKEFQVFINRGRVTETIRPYLPDLNSQGGWADDSHLGSPTNAQGEGIPVRIIS
jgi:hypothetical protein